RRGRDHARRDGDEARRPELRHDRHHPGGGRRHAGAGGGPRDALRRGREPDGERVQGRPGLGHRARGGGAHMKSPFPGVDPSIEACGLWEGFHNHLIEAIYQAIARVLPSGYTVDTAVRSYIVLVGAEGKDVTVAKPDVTVTRPTAEKKPRKTRGGTAVA